MCVKSAKHKPKTIPAPQGKTEVKGKLWHWITTKPENITHFKDYSRLQIKFCLSLSKLFSNNIKTKY